MDVSNYLGSSRAKQRILALLAALHGALALWMLVDPSGWFVTVPGVTDTGPFNPHLVRDVGIAYLTVAGGFGVAAYWLRVAFPVLGMVAIWFTGHAALHVADILGGALPASHIVGDLPGVFLPALLSVALAFWVRTDFILPEDAK